MTHKKYYKNKKTIEFIASGSWLNNYNNGDNIMLILTRRIGETLMIGDDVSITVIGVKGNQVRIGIDAPKDVAVHREEIFNRIKRDELRLVEPEENAG